MSNITQVTYRNDLLVTYMLAPKGIAELNTHGERNKKRALNKVIKDAIPEGGWGDIRLEAMLADHRAIEDLVEFVPKVQAYLYWPKEGKIQEWKLNPKARFFSNLHQNPDPLVIKDLQGIKFYKTMDPYTWQPRGGSTPNVVGGVLLFKENPFKNPEKYPGFQEMLKWNPRLAPNESASRKRYHETHGKRL